MKYINRLIIILLVLNNFTLFSQDTTDLGIWNITGMCLYKSQGVYSLQQIDSIVLTLPFGRDSVLLVYLGRKIPDISNYRLNRDHFKVIYTLGSSAGTHIMHTGGFLGINDTICKYMNMDTMLLKYCIPYRDSIPDGIWIRYRHDVNGIYRSESKTIANGFFDGESNVWLPNGILWAYHHYSKGYEQNYKDFFVDLISKHYEYREYQCNIVTKVIQFDSLWNLLYYFSYDFGSINVIDNKMVGHLNFYKNVYHGYGYDFDENGRVIHMRRYKYGKLVEDIEY